MGIKVSIKHAGEPGDRSQLAVTVVRVGGHPMSDPDETKHQLAAGQEVTLELGRNEFALVDDSEAEVTTGDVK